VSQTDLRTRVNFNLIRYANCWEDADVLLQGLAPQPGGKILSVASAGDNSFSLLTTQPELVVAVDISRPQLFLTELKKVCVTRFDREETLAFLGFAASNQREKSFDSLKKDLSSDARHYWESNLLLIEKGIIHQGKFEKYFQLFSHKILPLIHSRNTIDKLLSPKSESEQAFFYQSQWNTWRWRLLFKLFFSKYILGKLGRDPAFMNHVKGSVSQFILDKTARHLTSELAQGNFILHYALTGNFGALLPHYLQAENYPTIQKNIGQLQLYEGFAQEATAEFGRFEYMNLSNIFEYMDAITFRVAAELLAKGLAENGKMAYWNLMVPRRISERIPERVEYRQALSESLTAGDKGFFYGKFILDQYRG